MDHPCVIISNHQSILDMMGGYTEGVAESQPFLAAGSVQATSWSLGRGREKDAASGRWRRGPGELAGRARALCLPPASGLSDWAACVPDTITGPSAHWQPSRELLQHPPFPREEQAQRPNGLAR